MPALYPVFLKLDGLRVVVVGGGNVAAAKLDGLLAAGAQVTVVAPRIVDAVDDPGVATAYHQREEARGERTPTSRSARSTRRRSASPRASASSSSHAAVR